MFDAQRDPAGLDRKLVDLGALPKERETDMDNAASLHLYKIATDLTRRHVEAMREIARAFVEIDHAEESGRLTQKRAEQLREQLWGLTEKLG